LVAAGQAPMAAATRVQAWAAVGVSTGVQVVVAEQMYVGSAVAEQGRR